MSVYRNRLLAVKDYTGTATSGTLRQEVRYEYDTFNRRVARWVDTNGDGTSNLEEFYVYDGDDVALDFVDANGAAGGVSPGLKTRYLHGPAVDQILAQEDESTGGVLWMLTDQLGSVRDIVNHNGEGVSHISYDAFGNVVGGTGVLLTRYLWTGREFEIITGLQYNRNRWYDPTLGRWLSEDPIGFEGADYNLTRYVSNSPTIATDPEGKIIWFVVIAGVGAYLLTPDPANAPAPGDPIYPPNEGARIVNTLGAGAGAAGLKGAGAALKCFKEGKPPFSDGKTPPSAGPKGPIRPRPKEPPNMFHPKGPEPLEPKGAPGMNFPWGGLPGS